MTKLAEKILNDVLVLDAAERRELVIQLYEEFGAKDPGYEAAWAKEIQRREEMVAAGLGKFVPADEVLEKMRRLIEEKRAQSVG